MIQDESLFEEWDVDEDSFEPPEPSPWRRRVTIAVAAVTVVAMALVPLYNLIDRDPPLADNGLAICGFDYCTVQEGVRLAGLDQVMIRLANTYLTDEEASQLADSLATHLGTSTVELVVINHLEGRIKGSYDPTTRTIFVERPAQAWIVLHEVAHAVSSGHGQDFQEVVIELTRWLAPASTP
ncbi:MAG: hypothetical protein V3S26_01600 [Acidimicrobiia bacterium]